MTLEEQFRQAEADIITLSKKPDNNTLLRLYSYHKQVMKGDAPEKGPTNIFDIVGKAKHGAWSTQKGRTKDDCMKDYVDLVQELKGK